MNTYTHLLFDLDGTLFDFEAAEHAAFKKTCQTLHIPYSEELMQQYVRINESYWKLFELGKVSQPELAIRRFADLYSYLHIDGDADQANYCYRQNLAESSQIFPDTIPVCKALKQSYHICLITNGIADVQLKRLSASPLRAYTDEVFISEAIGSQKPRKEFFDYVFNHLQIQSSQALVIGDSLTSDIRGAQNANTDSCWFNPNGKQNPYSDILPTYEINSLPQLLTLLQFT